MKRFLNPIIENRKSIIIFLITSIYKYANDDKHKDLFHKYVLLYQKMIDKQTILN